MEAIEVKSTKTVTLNSLPVYTLFKFPKTNTIQIKIDSRNNCMFLDSVSDFNFCKDRIHSHPDDSEVIPVELVEVRYKAK